MASFLKNLSNVTKRGARSVRTGGRRLGAAWRQLQFGTSGCITMLVPDLNNPYFILLASHVEQALRAGGYTLLLLSANNDRQRETELLELLRRQQPQALLWVPLGGQSAARLPYPVVTIDQSLPYYDSVQADQQLGGVLLAQHIISLGHSCVGVLSGANNSESRRQRHQGFYRTAEGKFTIAWDIEVPLSLELNDRVAAQLSEGDVSLIVAPNDAVAIGVIRALRARGIAVPGDMSILGFDDVPWAALLDPPLSTVQQPIRDIAARAVHLLTARIQDPQCPVSHVVLPVHFVVRRSAIPISAFFTTEY